ncbi:MAG: peptidyl-prolyl cis-trans isomerase [Desulfobacterales bacterium]|nr:peptidyl-prolyl cis-trans isomerase [Desulfobacterales bacterium]
MHRLIRVFFFLAVLLLLSTGPLGAGGLPDNEELASINGQVYTVADFRNWWNNWREAETRFPPGPEPFIDWHLLVQEAERMELYTVPSYLDKVRVFLQARSLMQMKYDEIDSRISISEKEIRDLYSREYTPRRRIEIFYFADEEQTESAFRQLKSGAVTWDELGRRPEDKDGPQFKEEKTVRPRSSLPGDWQETLMGMEAGQVALLSLPKGRVVVWVRELINGDEDDYESVKKGIRTRLWNRAEAELNNKIVRRLRDKFHVTIDEQLLAELDVLGEVDRELLDRPVVTSDLFALSLGYVYDKARKGIEVRNRYAYTAASVQGLKQGIVDSYINHRILVEEAMLRHYEERDPIRLPYRFYTENRLIKELETRVFRANATVSGEEISRYYQENIDRFRQPVRVSLAAVKLGNDEKIIERMWNDISRGEDFFEVARRNGVEVGTVREMDRANLDPAVAKVVAGLAVGEVSRPFPVNQQKTMVRLIKRSGGNPTPLFEVRDRIVKELQQEKFERLRSEYLARLRDVSTISVRRQVWDRLRDEIGD